MSIKLYHCECVFAVFPFGNGLPMCIKDMERTKTIADLKPCIEKGCEHYKKFETIGKRSEKDV